MLYIIAGVVFGLCLLFTYIAGLKQGLKLAQGKPPEQIIKPIQDIVANHAAKEATAETDRIIEGWNNIMSYTGEPQKPQEEGDKT